jgi:hypothetical protein
MDEVAWCPADDGMCASLEFCGRTGREEIEE